MHIHNYEKLWLGLSLVLIVAFIGTITYGAVGAGVDMVDNGETVDPDTLTDHPDFGDPGVEKVGPNEYEVHVVARQFFFQPNTITVPEDSTVTFHVTSGDVIHGFEVAGTNANTMAIPGEVATVTVDTGEPGTYGMVCHEYCGAAHHDMAGTIEVVPEGEFEGVSEE